LQKPGNLNQGLTSINSSKSQFAQFGEPGRMGHLVEISTHLQVKGELTNGSSFIAFET